MRLATGSIASLVLTIGALMLLVAGAVSESAMGRGTPTASSNLRRKLYNYSTNSGSSSSYSGQSSYSGGDDDEASYYESNQSYKADGSSYNGRDQQWGGQSVQQYTDDEEPEVTIIEYEEDKKFTILGKLGGLTGMETLAIVGLMLLMSMSVLAVVLTSNGFNLIHLFQVYCFRGALFGHEDQKTEPDQTSEPGEDFVRLDDC